MKKLYLLVIFGMMIFGNGKGQNLIAVQNGGMPTFFTNLDTAIINSTHGDTLYIPGGSWNITFPLNKQLHFVGVGYHPDSTLATHYTQILNSVTLLTGTDGGSLTGLKINGELRFGTSASNQTINNYSIIRCFILGAINLGISSPSSSSNNIFRENILPTIDGFFSAHNSIYNNIISNVHNFGNNNIFSNNIFLYPGVPCCPSCWYTASIIANVSNSIFRNNIFLYESYSAGTICGSVSNCFFDNNLFVQNLVSPFSTGCLDNNSIVSQAQVTIFVNQTGNTFDFSHDYHLKASCPGKNAGNDGTDIGIYGGIYPWKEGGIPFNPHFQSAKISSATDTNGNLNVKIKVAAQDR